MIFWKLQSTEDVLRYRRALNGKLQSKSAVEVYEKIEHFKMAAPGINPLADVADTDSLFRIFRHQSSPDYCKLVISTSIAPFPEQSPAITTSPDTPP